MTPEREQVCGTCGGSKFIFVPAHSNVPDTRPCPDCCPPAEGERDSVDVDLLKKMVHCSIFGWPDGKNSKALGMIETLAAQVDEARDGLKRIEYGHCAKLDCPCCDQDVAWAYEARQRARVEGGK